jgi:hypothetical protein
MPNDNILAITWREQVTFDEMNDNDISTRPTHLVSANSETTVSMQTWGSTLTHYPDSEPTSIFSLF